MRAWGGPFEAGCGEEEATSKSRFRGRGRVAARGARRLNDLGTEYA